MIKQKIKAVVIITALAVAISLNSCKRCYKCRPLNSLLICKNATDTFTVSCFNKREAIDSINYYENKGYNVDTLYMAYYTYDEYKLCGKDAYSSAMSRMDLCNY